MTTHDLIERLEFNGGCQNLHCGDSSRCHACDGCRQNEAAQALSTLTDEVARLGSLNCPHCGERALSDDEFATLTKGEGTER